MSIALQNSLSKHLIELFKYCTTLFRTTHSAMNNIILLIYHRSSPHFKQSWIMSSPTRSHPDGSTPAFPKPHPMVTGTDSSVARCSWMTIGSAASLPTCTPPLSGLSSTPLHAPKTPRCRVPHRQLHISTARISSGR
jgi:hypothetical protein